MVISSFPRAPCIPKTTFNSMLGITIHLMGVNLVLIKLVLKSKFLFFTFDFLVNFYKILSLKRAEPAF